MLKGYIDRVWNNGLLMEMGTNYHSIKFVGWRWLERQRIICPDGLGKKYKRLFKNMCSYLGIEDADVTFLCNTVYSMGKNFTRAIISRYYLRYGYGRCTIRCVKNAVAE